MRGKKNDATTREGLRCLSNTRTLKKSLVVSRPIRLALLHAMRCPRGPLTRSRCLTTDSRPEALTELNPPPLIFLFVLVVVVIANPSFVSFITVFFVVLFAVLAVFLNLIFAFGGTASPRSANKPK